jgi:hypothetical protein
MGERHCVRNLPIDMLNEVLCGSMVNAPTRFISS